jgi:neutral ceramidase
MNYHNRLISGDNKGYAAYALEKRHGKDFVAAFAQSNCGDVTPNLNLNNTGPGGTDTESTRIIGARQARAAEKLLENASEPLRGPIAIRHEFVDFSRLAVQDAFTGAGEQRTCPSAFGYAFAAGSTEDGGGHSLFQEGMKAQRPLIDSLVRTAAPSLSPTAELSQCQKPKAVLFATGLAKPPAQEQVLALGIVRIGQLALVVGPAEFTTMAGRRIREAVAKESGIAANLVVIAGYANEYAGYVTTREEYESQQYEGGHTLFGPWTEAGYRQEFVRLARAVKNGESVSSQVMPEDMRKRTISSTMLEGPDENAPPGDKFGDIVQAAKERYVRGDCVTVSFWTGSPVNEYQRTDRFMTIERLNPNGGHWEVIRSDGDWDTTCRWRQMLDSADRRPGVDTRLPGLRIAPMVRIPRPEPFQATLTWQTNAETLPGTYRISYLGRCKAHGKVTRFRATTRPFEVK